MRGNLWPHLNWARYEMACWVAELEMTRSQYILGVQLQGVPFTLCSRTLWQSPSKVWTLQKVSLGKGREPASRAGGGGLAAQSCLPLAAPRTGAPQAPLSMGFPRQESGVGSHFLLQGISLTQRSNSHLLCCRYSALQANFHQLSHQGSWKSWGGKTSLVVQ